MAGFEADTLFPTFVVKRQWEEAAELNALLKEHIALDRKEDPEGIYRSNSAGCWHSKDSCLQRYGKAGAKLNDMFGQAFHMMAKAHGMPKDAEVVFNLNAWTMVYGDRHYAAVHLHPNCHFSGVYYVDAGPKPKELPQATGVTRKSGDLEFVDTRSTGGHQVQGLRLLPDAKYSAKTGLMLTFPQWLPHYVHPVHGRGERIAIACNAKVTKLAPKQPKE